jgi:hypothetical protein
MNGSTNVLAIAGDISLFGLRACRVTDYWAPGHCPPGCAAMRVIAQGVR